MDANTYTLIHPLDLPAKVGEPAGLKLTTISFRRPAAKDLAAIERASKDGFVAAQIMTIAALGDISFVIAERLDMVDFDAASEIAGSFFPKSE